MGPDKNHELYDAVAQPRVQALQEEFSRRTFLAGTMGELSDEFKGKDYTTRAVTEPTLFIRLYALSQVQASHLGIAGFNPLEFIDPNSYDGNVTAKAAPHHDEFKGVQQDVVRTRILSLQSRVSRSEGDIEIFGFNFYQPDMQVGDAFKDDAKKLVVIGAEGDVIDETTTPITGETVLFGVRNKKTGDAKLYQVVLETDGDTVGNGRNIQFNNAHEATVNFANGQVARVTELTDKLQNQAIEELKASVEEFQKKKDPNSQLSEAEKAAANAVINR